MLTHNPAVGSAHGTWMMWTCSPLARRRRRPYRPLPHHWAPCLGSQQAVWLLRPPMLKEFVYIASKDKSETYARDVKQTTLDHAVETGHTNKVGLHLHGLLSIQHTTNLRRTK